jgi:hypothetical protein
MTFSSIEAIRFLEQFFRNLLMGEKNELRNRYMLVYQPEELAAPSSAPPSITN